MLINIIEVYFYQCMRMSENVYFDKIQEYILALYDLWKVFDEKKDMCEVLAKMPTPKLQIFQFL